MKNVKLKRECPVAIVDLVSNIYFLFLFLIKLNFCFIIVGYARRKHREPCRRVVSLLMSLRVDKIYERRIVWDKLLGDKNSEPYAQLSYEARRAVSISKHQ